MATEKQIAANRENAKKSTGPRNHEERALLEVMAAARWRQRRIWGMESAALMAEIRRVRGADSAALPPDDFNPEVPNTSLAYRAALAFRTIADTTGLFKTLHRHETRFNRQYLRCRRELLTLNEQK